MRCPFCRSDSRVTDTRNIANVGIRRRRKCIGCGNQWTTFETIEKVKQVARLPEPGEPGLTPVQRAKFNLIKAKLRAKQRVMRELEG